MGTALYNELIEVPCIPCLRKQDQVQTVTVTGHGNIQDGGDSDEETRPLIRKNQDPKVWVPIVIDFGMNCDQKKKQQ